jgi:hypothetical protein
MKGRFKHDERDVCVARRERKREREREREERERERERERPDLLHSAPIVTDRSIARQWLVWCELLAVVAAVTCY